MELFLEKLENVLMDDDDCVDMPNPSTAMVSMSRTPSTTQGASSSVPQLPTSISTQFCPSLTLLPPRGGACSSHDARKRKEYVFLQLHYHHMVVHVAFMVLERGRNICFSNFTTLYVIDDRVIVFSN
jgi:hypothetical protein